MTSPSRRSKRVAAKNARNRLQEMAEYERNSSDDDANSVTKQTAAHTEKYNVDASAESQDEDWKRGRTPKYRQRASSMNWQETVRALIGMRPDMAPALMGILQESEPNKVADQAKASPHLVIPNVDNLARTTPPASPAAFFDPNGVRPTEQPMMQPQGVPSHGNFALPNAYTSYGAGMIPPWQGQPLPNTPPMASAMNYQSMWQPWQQPFVQQQIDANQQIAELTNQLNTVLNMQVSSARRQELKELKPLTGFESAGKLKNFFRRFEEMTAGCDPAKKSSYLREKCEDRALRIFEKVSKDRHASYDEVKKQMTQQISESSTESVEAIHLLTQGLKRAYSESVRDYSNRVARTVKTAFPTADDSSSEMLLCYYFRIGLNNNQLSTAMTSLQNLSFEETVSHAIRMDTELSAIRGGSIGHNTRRTEMQRPSSHDQMVSRRQPEQSRPQPSRHQASMGFRPPTGPNHSRQDGQRSAQQGHMFPQQNRPSFTEIRHSNGNNNRANQVQHDEGKKKKSEEEKRAKPSGSVPTLQLEVKGLFVRGLLDTGASISIMSQGCYAAIAGEEGRLVHVADRRPCIASNGQPLKVIGEVDLPVQYKQTELPTARFTVAADTFGHDMIIGTDLLEQLGFEFFDRRNGCHHSLSSLHEIDRSPRNQQTPVRIMLTTRVQPKESKVVKVHFDRKKDALYIMEPRHINDDTTRLESALVGNDTEVVNWLIHNKSQTPIHLESESILGYASEVERIFDNNLSVSPEEGTSDRVFTCFSREDDGDLPFTLQLQDSTSSKDGAEQRLETLLKYMRERCGPVSQDMWNTIEQLVTDAADCFAVNDSELTQSDIVTHRIDTGSAAPIRANRRLVPQAMRKDVIAMVQKYLAQGVIRKSHSPWASPIVLVKKKDGSIRMCVDYRKLNNVTEKDAFPVPNINEMLSSFCNKKYFSTFDLLSGYWQIRMDPDSVQKTAFTSPLGLYEFTVMPFGLTNAVATFQRAIEGIFEDILTQYVFVYVDDILVASETWEEHILHLKEVLKRLKNAGLRLKAQKCCLAKDEVQFLGHLLTADGLKMDPEKVAPMRDYPEPKNVKELQRFLGLASYNRKFVEGFAQIASPLHRLIKPKTPFAFDENCRKAFQTLRKKMCQEVTLQFPDFDAAQSNPKRRFVIMTDASIDGLGAVLCQGDKDGHYRPIHFASRRSSEAERKYPAFDLEALAIRFACEKFEQYIRFTPCMVLTDHRPLVGAFSNRRCDSKRVDRYVSELLTHFQLEIIHISGKKNVMADAISRAFGTPTPSPRETVDEAGTAMAITIRPGEWKARLKEDEEFKSLINYLDDGSLPTDVDESSKVVEMSASYSTDENHLYFVDTNGNKKKVVPKTARQALLQEIHAGTVGVHASAPKLYDSLAREYYWKGMRKTCEDLCIACETCALNRTARKTTPPLESIRTTDVMELLCVDLLKMGPSRRGNLYAVVMIDHFSRFLCTAAVRDKSSTSVVSAIMEGWIYRFGVPKRLHSDNGTEFRNSTMQEMCDGLGIARSTSSPYHPQGNGSAERANRAILAMLRKSLTSRYDWDERLPVVTYAHNALVHRSTQISPFELVFGRPAKLPIVDECEHQPDERNIVDFDSYAEMLRENRRWLTEQARTNVEAAAAEQERQYNRRNNVRAHDFVIGDRVFVKRPRMEVSRKQHHKLQPLNEGPFNVTGTRRSLIEIEKPDREKEWIRVERATRCPDTIARVNVVRVDPSVSDVKKKDMMKTRQMTCSSPEGDTMDKYRRSRSPLVRERPRSPPVRRRLRSRERSESRSPLKRRPTRPVARPHGRQEEAAADPGPKVNSVVGMVRLAEGRPPQRGKPMQPNRVNPTKRARTAQAPGKDAPGEVKPQQTKYGLLGDSFAKAVEHSVKNPLDTTLTVSDINAWSHRREVSRYLVCLGHAFTIVNTVKSTIEALTKLFARCYKEHPGLFFDIVAPPPCPLQLNTYDDYANSLFKLATRFRNVSYIGTKRYHSISAIYFFGTAVCTTTVNRDGSLTATGRRWVAANLREVFEVPLKFKEKKTDETAKKREGGPKA
ncbi:hypothetical protein QR680_007081 [Steinernema hermaphroditum]|uniref:RNA-directed DNA polymerase n=1 Tax=Steinernema hermaphroditum TaxID=289476 RepID=A0AA39LYG7_9BILA|nr:hypothetical protein QR680_007081 [Steinernema hermaphroditum]